MTDRDHHARPDAESESARRLDECMTRRNRTEFVAGGIAMTVLVVTAVVILATASAPFDFVQAAAQLLLAAGLAFALWRLMRHVQRQRQEEPGRSPRETLAVRLRRERDLVASVRSWYIGPMLPGFVLLWGSFLLAGFVVVAAVGAALTAALMVWIANANARAARDFDSQLRALGSAA